MKKIIGILAAAIAAIPSLVHGATLTSGDLYNTAASSGLAASATGGLTTYVTTIFNWILGIVGFIAILGFLISAVLYFTAAGDEEKMEKAKNAMTYSIIGVVVALVGFVIMGIVNEFLLSGTTI